MSGSGEQTSLASCSPILCVRCHPTHTLCTYVHCKSRCALGRAGLHTCILHQDSHLITSQSETPELPCFRFQNVLFPTSRVTENLRRSVPQPCDHPVGPQSLPTVCFRGLPAPILSLPRLGPISMRTSNTLASCSLLHVPTKSHRLSVLSRRRSLLPSPLRVTCVAVAARPSPYWRLSYRALNPLLGCVGWLLHR